MAASAPTRAVQAPAAHLLLRNRLLELYRRQPRLQFLLLSLAPRLLALELLDLNGRTVVLKDQSGLSAMT